MVAVVKPAGAVAGAAVRAAPVAQAARREGQWARTCPRRTAQRAVAAVPMPSQAAVTVLALAPPVQPTLLPAHRPAVWGPVGATRLQPGRPAAAPPAAVGPAGQGPQAAPAVRQATRVGQARLVAPARAVRAAQVQRWPVLAETAPLRPTRPELGPLEEPERQGQAALALLAVAARAGQSAPQARAGLVQQALAALAPWHLPPAARARAELQVRQARAALMVVARRPAVRARWAPPAAAVAPPAWPATAAAAQPLAAARPTATPPVATQ